SLIAVSPPQPLPGELVLLFFRQDPIALLGTASEIGNLHLAVQGLTMSDPRRLDDINAIPGRPDGTKTIVEVRMPADASPGESILETANRRLRATTNLVVGQVGHLLDRGNQVALSSNRYVFFPIEDPPVGASFVRLEQATGRIIATTSDGDFVRAI